MQQHTHRSAVPEEEYSVAFLPVACFNPIYLTPQIRNTGKKQIWWGPLLQPLESRPHSHRGVKITEQRGDLTIFKAGM